MSVCGHCGKEIGPESILGMCPECLIKVGLEDTGTVSAVPGRVEPPPLETLRDQFPQLEILEFLGRGGMGAVYKARQPQLDRVVALKILLPDIGRDPAFAERFAIEARALARLNHPNILTIHDFGQTGDLFYFVMEFVDGLNLRELLDAERIAAREALAIVPQICDALQFAHDHGIVHRDIKPENILLDRLGRVKVADFGLAKLMGGAEPTAPQGSIGATFTLTEAGRVLGTPHYMAPEQMERPREVDHRADIYALGVVFYQMLTGELPGQTLEPPSHKVRLDVRLDEVVLRALEKLPELRYQHVSEVKTRVETIAETLGEGKEEKKTQVPPKTQKSAKALTLLKIIQVLLVDKKTGRLKSRITILKIILVLLVLHAIVPPIPFLPEIVILGLLGWGGYTLVQRIRRNKKPSQPLEINPSEKKPERHRTPLSPDETIPGTKMSDEPDSRVPRIPSPALSQKVDWWAIIQTTAWHAVLLIVLNSVTISIITYYKNIYSGLGGVLPLATRLAISLCGFVQNFGFFLFPPLVTLDFLVCWAAQSVGGKKALRIWFWTGCAMLLWTAAMTVFLASFPLFKLVERNNPATDNGPLWETGFPLVQFFFLGSLGLIGGCCYYLIRQHIYRSKKSSPSSSNTPPEPELPETGPPPVLDEMVVGTCLNSEETPDIPPDLKPEAIGISPSPSGTNPHKSENTNELSTPPSSGPSPKKTDEGSMHSVTSLLAIWGAFAAVRIIWLWGKTLLSGEAKHYLIENEPDRINFFWETLRASFVLCASSYEFWVVSFMATVVGWIAVTDIRRSSGRLTGLRLATFGGLVFPLFVLDVAIFYFFYAIGNVSEIRYLWYGGGSFCRGILLLISGCVVLLMAWVDKWVVRCVWRAVKNPALPLVESIQEEFRRAIAPTSSAETRILSLPSVLAIVAVCVAAVTIGYWVKALQGANLFMASVEPETPRTLWKLILFSFHFNTLPPQFSAGVLVTTILGWLAVGQIQRSSGRLRGLRLAVFDCLLFPLIALDLFIYSIFHTIEEAIYRYFVWDSGVASFLWGLIPFLGSASVVALLAWVDYHIVRRVWRAVNRSDGKPDDDGGSSSAGPASSETVSSATPPREMDWRAVIQTTALHATLLLALWARYTTLSIRAFDVSVQPIQDAQNYGLLVVLLLTALDFLVTWFASKRGGRKWLKIWAVTGTLIAVALGILLAFRVGVTAFLTGEVDRESTIIQSKHNAVGNFSDPTRNTEENLQTISAGVEPDVAFYRSAINESRVELGGRALAGTRLTVYIGDNPENGWSCILPMSTSWFWVKVEKEKGAECLGCRVFDETTHAKIFSKSSIKQMGSVDLSQGTLVFAYRETIPATRKMGVYTQQVGEWTASSGEKLPVWASLTPPAAYIPSPGSAKPAVAPEEPAPDPALVEQKPELRFLAWQSSRMDRHDRELDLAWHPDGLPVGVNGEERKQLGEMNHSFIGDSTDQDRYFLYLWVKHPLFDQDSMPEMQILDAAGQPLQPGVQWGSGSSVPGWKSCTLRENDKAQWPSQVNLRLRYTIRPWKEEVTIPSDYNTSDNRMLSCLPHGLSVTSVGQDTEGDAFIAVTRDLTVDPDIQCGFVAITRDGRRRMCRCQHSVQQGNLLPEKLKVETPLSHIQEFRLLSRPVREVEFKNVILRPDPGKAQTPVTAEAVSIPLSGISPTTATAPTTVTTATAPSETPDGVLTNSIGMKLKRIPAGAFLMGVPYNETKRGNYDDPQHKVTLTEPYYLGVYEVTQEQYEKVMGTNPSEYKGTKRPVEGVKWNDAQEFCRKLSRLEKNMTYRLPTEAEWEYAARAGTQTAYYWGDRFDGLYAWNSANSGGTTHEVGTRQPNAWGLYDVSGNVLEWCEDWYTTKDPAIGEEVDPKGPTFGSSRVIRGGGWYCSEMCCRSSYRDNDPPNDPEHRIGFRVVAAPAGSGSVAAVKLEAPKQP